MRPNQKGVVLCRAGRDRGKWGTRAWVYWRGLCKGEDGNLKPPAPSPPFDPGTPLNFPPPQIWWSKIYSFNIFFNSYPLKSFQNNPISFFKCCSWTLEGWADPRATPMHNPLQQGLSVIKCICYAYLLWLLIIYKQHLNQTRNLSWNLPMINKNFFSVD